jgi:hypothetical protein
LLLPFAELEVSRLAQALRRIQAPTNITAVDYSKSRARFYSGTLVGFQTGNEV